jgi:uncharacterized membrane protein (DUF373 family)
VSRSNTFGVWRSQRSPWMILGMTNLLKPLAEGMTMSVTDIDQNGGLSAFSQPARRGQVHNLTSAPAPLARLASTEAAVSPADSPVALPTDTSSEQTTESSRPHLGVLEHAEDLVHYVVAAILMAVAIFMLVDTTRALTLSMTKASFPAAATNAVNGVLFAVIIVEITRTVLSHFDKKGLQLQPFLIIGIVSAVRGVLSEGARLSLNNMGPKQVHMSLVELGIDAAVVLGLAASLVLIRRYGSPTSIDELPLSDNAMGATS